MTPLLSPCPYDALPRGMPVVLVPACDVFHDDPGFWANRGGPVADGPVGWALAELAREQAGRPTAERLLRTGLRLRLGPHERWAVRLLCQGLICRARSLPPEQAPWRAHALLAGLALAVRPDARQAARGALLAELERRQGRG